jgi:C1A family cysteine protease
LFIYYNERAMEGTVDQDSGARIRDGIKSVVKLGVCPEDEWPYSTDLTVVTEKPPDPAFIDARRNKAIAYHRVTQNLRQMKGCLAEGYPFVFGFAVYSSFESDEVTHTGVVPMPDPNTEEQVGGHAVMAVGYDDSQQRFIVRNSWGTDWGMAGYCTMPYAYLTDHQYSNDFWTIRGVTGQATTSRAAA